MADYDDKNMESMDDDASSTGSVQYDDSVLKKIINTAVQETDGVLGLGASVMEGLTSMFKSGDAAATRGVSVTQHDNALDVDIKLMVEYGRSIPAIVAQLEEKIRSAMIDMTGLTVDKINVAIVDTMTRAEYDAKTQKHSNEETKGTETPQ